MRDHLRRTVRHHRPLPPWGGTAARVVLALVWLWAAWAKIGEPLGSARAVRAYQVLPESLVEAVAGGLPVLELMLGALLLLGLCTRGAAFGSAVLLAVFLGAIAQSWARGLSIDCGCFGGGGESTGGAGHYLVELARDLALLVLAVLLTGCRRTRFAADGLLRQPG